MEDLIMKKILSVLLILVLILSGIKLTPVFADELTPAPDNSVIEKSIVFTQDDVPITSTSSININKVIKAEIKIKVNLDTYSTKYQPLTQDNYINYELGKAFKFAEKENDNSFVTQIKDKTSGKTAAEVTFTRDSSGKIDVKFDFSKANGDLFKQETCVLDISTYLKIDTDHLNYSDPKPVKILDNEYSINIIPDTLTSEKSGEVDWSDASVRWTVKVNRHLKNNPDVVLPLTGFKFEDDISKIGEYVSGSLAVSGSSVIPEESSSKVSYTLKDSDLDSDNMGTTVITFKTKISTSDLSNGRTYRNEAKFIGNSSQVTSNKCDVTIRRFGSKSGQVISDTSSRKIKWVIDFNEESKDIGTVLIKDIFQNDSYRGIKTQTYDSNEYQTYENGLCIATGTAVYDSSNNTFTIPDVSKKTRLIIYTNTNILPTDPEYYVFNNTAEVRFGTDGADPKAVFIGNTSFDVSWISKKASLNINGNNFNNRAGFITDWDVSFARKNDDTGEYKLYDVFIFDNSIMADRSTINDTDYKVTEVGNTVALAGFVPLSKIVSNVNRHQRLINPDNANVLTKNENNIQHSVYEIRKNSDNTIVGHILELSNFPAGKSSISFQSKMVEPEQILTDNGHAYNYMALIKENIKVDDIESKPEYKSELIRKQVLSRDAATRFLDDYNTVAADADVFRNGSPVNNADNGYNKETRTIIYKLSINGANIKDTDNDLGDITVTDEINPDFEFINIKDNKQFLIYEGTPNINGYVNSSGDELSGNLSTDILTSSFEGNKMTLSFKKLNKSYVVFLGMKLKESSHGKYLNSYRDISNIAKVTTAQKSFGSPDKFAQSEQKIKIDERFLWKDIDNSKSIDEQVADGFLTWRVLYKPYKEYLPNDNTEVILYDTMCSETAIAREANSEKLIFYGNNFTITEGDLDKYGNFTPRHEINTGLSNIFTYDKTLKVFKINIPDKRKSYKITYITYLKDKTSGKYSITNSLALYEQSHKTPIQEPNVQYSPQTSSSATSRGFEHIKIINTDKTTGQPVSGASFKLVKPDTPYNIDIQTDKNGIVIYPKIGSGNYILTESETPEGYVKNTTEYRIKVTALEIGMKIELDKKYSDVIKEGNTLLIASTPIVHSNEDVGGNSSGGGGGIIIGSIGSDVPIPQPEDKDNTPVSIVSDSPQTEDKTDGVKNDVSKPHKANKLKYSADESKNTNEDIGDDIDNEDDIEDDDNKFDSVDGEDDNYSKSVGVHSTTHINHSTKNDEPKTDNEKSVHKYRIDDIPTPISENSPEEIMLIDEHGRPLGIYVKTHKKDGSYEYINLDDGTPLGKKTAKTLPKTGESDLPYSILGTLILLLATYLFKKKE